MEKAKLAMEHAEVAKHGAQEDPANQIRTLDDLELMLAAGAGEPLVDWG